ncbi:hypothetical protein DFR86_02515 [Acidianus sulfidivorans JP7]|uniref:Zinc-hook domain-containing protein n=1 Tax=Acidianus sulfidivorans JP7 TaxID=619593 RepID=A0A2U9IKI5_9CREN|nr:archaea-specific SMC-related protein [Acidianus sulfidivorans]AWR96531.1 hypothetical protein DFR86_02515 [Acidianus sulfidivorans JP7]
MKVSVYNIGGIISPLEYQVEKGVNIYKAPNAYGKTSLAKAMISLLTSSIRPDDLLNIFADQGYIELEYEGKLYYRRITRIKNKVIENSKLLMDDDRATLLSYFSPENKLLTQIFSGDDNVEWFISTTSKVQELKAKKNELEARLQQLSSELDDLNSKYKEAMDLQNKIKLIENEIENLEKEKESDKILNKTSQTISVTRENKISEIKEKIEVKKKELNDLQNKLNKLEQEIAQKQSMVTPEIRKSYEDQLNNIIKQLQTKSSLRNEAEIEIRLLERVLDEIKDSEKKQLSTCYVCGSHVDPDTWKLREDIISKELKEKTNIFESIKKETDELLNKKAEIEKRLKDLDSLQNEINKLNQNRNSLLTKIENVKSQIDDLERQKREMEDRYNRSNEIIRVVDLNEFTSKRIEELNKKKGEYEYELSLTGVPSQILDKISEKKKELETLQKTISDLDKEYIKRLTVAREEFVSIANSLLRELEFDITAEIDENYRLIVKRHGAILELRKLSSSERTTLALILVITALKSYFRSPFFIVDESFMTFDQKRFEKIVKYLRGITDYIIITRSDESLEFLREPTEPLISS